jgi:hypothetical protein
MALEPRPKLVNTFLVALCVVEQREEGGKRIRDRRGTKVVLEDLEHLETFAIKCGPRILEEETSWPILNCHPKLTLPKLAGQSVPSVRHKDRIRTSRRETRGAKPEQEDVTCLKVIIR